MNSPGGEESILLQMLLLLLLLALLFKAIVTGIPPEFIVSSCDLFGWSELLDRKRETLFFGLSTVDFDLGRPTFGSDPVSATALSNVFFIAGSTPS